MSVSERNFRYYEYRGVGEKPGKHKCSVGGISTVQKGFVIVTNDKDVGHIINKR